MAYRITQNQLTKHYFLLMFAGCHSKKTNCRIYPQKHVYAG